MGGYISYKKTGVNSYEFTIVQYRDCRPPSIGGGTPAALQSDNPIFVAIFRGDGVFIDSFQINATAHGGQIVPASNTGTPCLNQLNQCINKLIFRFNRSLPSNNSGYFIVTQRCCLAAGIENIVNSSTQGLTTMLFVPPNFSNSNSAKFNNDLNKTICINKSQTLDFSATDADGDSLSYSLCHLQHGGSQNDPKPRFTTPPPYSLINYAGGYNAQDPLGIAPDFNLNPTTGELNFKPNKLGYYHLGICCKEWRQGVEIQQVERNFLVRIVDCNDILEVEASADLSTAYNVPVKVSAQGADSYKWEILPTSGSTNGLVNFDNDSIQNPTVLFDQSAIVKSGRYFLIVTGTDINGCKGIDTTMLTVNEDAYFFVPTAFSPNGDGLNDYLNILTSGYEFQEIRIYNRWGNIVFKSNSLLNRWRGEYQGTFTFLSPDTFHWVARAKDNNGEIKTFKGSVVLVR